MQSISTIGNATLIAYDQYAPVLSTDPWFGDEDDAYFGSWTLSHSIPPKYKNEDNVIVIEGDIIYEYKMDRDSPYHDLPKTIYRKYRYSTRIHKFLRTNIIDPI